MSAIGERAVQAQSGVADLESALEKTQKALKTAENVDLMAAKAKKKSSKLIKMLLIVTVVGVTVIVARKLMGGSSSNSDAYGSKAADS